MDALAVLAGGAQRLVLGGPKVRAHRSTAAGWRGLGERTKRSEVPISWWSNLSRRSRF